MVRGMHVGRKFGVLVVLAFTVAGATTVSAETVSFGGRSSNLVVPTGYDAGTPAPLVLLLHGYAGSGAGQDAYMGFSAISDEFGFLMLNPDGLVDGGGSRYWTATDACCNFYGSSVSDSDFLAGLIGEVQSLYNIDPNRVFITGHSNGGFMSYRMACDHADLVAAIASMAGATFDNPASCAPFEPVHVLQIHGTLDDTILYGGGSILGTAYPSAAGSVDRWNTYNGCSGVADPSTPSIDIEISLPGDETSIVKYVDGCDANGSGEIWTLANGSHIPNFSSQYARSVIEYFYAHPRVLPTAVPALRPGPRLALIALLAILPAVAQWNRGRATRSAAPVEPSGS